MGATATVSRSQGCADISIQIRRFVLVSVNQSGTSVLPSQPIILNHVQRTRLSVHEEKHESRLERAELFFRCAANISLTQCVFKENGKKWLKSEEIWQIFMTKHGFIRCSMFPAKSSLWYKKARPVISNHLSESIAHYATLAAGTHVTAKAPAAHRLH